MAARDLSPLCSPTDDDAVCMCGCSGYDDRCNYYMYVSEHMTTQVRMHYCCKIPGRDRDITLERHGDGFALWYA